MTNQTTVTYVGIAGDRSTPPEVQTLGHHFKLNVPLPVPGGAGDPIIEKLRRNPSFKVDGLPPIDIAQENQQILASARTRVSTADADFNRRISEARQAAQAKTSALVGDALATHNAAEARRLSEEQERAKKRAELTQAQLASSQAIQQPKAPTPVPDVRPVAPQVAAASIPEPDPAPVKAPAVPNQKKK